MLLFIRKYVLEKKYFFEKIDPSSVKHLAVKEHGTFEGGKDVHCD